MNGLQWFDLAALGIGIVGCVGCLIHAVLKR